MSKHIERRVALLTVLLTMATACDESTTAVEAVDPRGGRFVGFIEVVQSTPVQAGQLRTPIAAPDTVDVNVPFTATITTIGLNSCYRASGANVVVSARRAVLTPFDEIIGTGCFEALVNLPRPVIVVFSQRGEATLRVEGRRLLDSDLRSATDVALEKRMYVR